MLLHTYPRRLRRAAVIAAVASSSAALFAGLPASSASAEQSPAACTNVSIVNGSFEAPLVAANSWAQFDDSLVPGWTTTATDRKIEIWRSPFQGVPVADGAQFAELNATQRATLYQDFATTPGETFRWQFQHRGRTGIDTMEVRFGAPDTALALYGTISNGLTWGAHSGLYTVPPGQTTTRLSFDSISSANGNASYGNFIDAVSVTSGACVVTSKSVVNLTGGSTVRLGDTLQYSVVATNDGASGAALASMVDALPAGISFVPGSITVTDGAVATTATDEAADDIGEYDVGSREVRARVGDGASSASGGTLAAGDSVTVSFSVLVDSVTALPAVENSALVSFTHAVSNLPSGSMSNTTSTPVAADSPGLTIVTSGSVNLASHQSAATVGDAITWSYVVENTGDVPLSSVFIVDPEGGTVSCSPTSLSVGESATCTGTATRVVTEADLAAGSVSNGATAMGTPPYGAEPVASTESVAIVNTVMIAPSIDVSVAHDNLTSPGSNAPASAGDRLRARFVVTNTGNSMLDAITIFDPVFGSVTCVVSTLGPGESTTCAADALYVVTAQDAVAGVVSRTITATGSAAIGLVTASVSDQELVHLDVVIATESSGLASTGSAAANPLALALALLAAGLIALGAARVQSARRSRRASLTV